jgi:hypothetical protein
MVVTFGVVRQLLGVGGAPRGFSMFTRSKISLRD